MKTLITKIALVLMLVLIFGSFQYGGIDTPPPFKNSWQSYAVGFGLAVAVLFLLQEVWSRIKTKTN
jgi:hypothetical protein